MRQLGQLEAAVMDRLWSSDRAVTVREVLEDLQRDRSIAYTTVMTVMDNLHGKGLLSRELDGRAYRYRPVRSREEHTAAIMEQVLSASTNPRAALLHFVQQIPPAELAELRTALDELDPDQGPRG